MVSVLVSVVDVMVVVMAVVVVPVSGGVKLTSGWGGRIGRVDKRTETKKSKISLRLF